MVHRRQPSWGQPVATCPCGGRHNGPVWVLSYRHGDVDQRIYLAGV